MPITPNPYTGPAVPTVYDPAWRRYTNLAPAQVLAFQSFPQDLTQYARTRRWLAEVSGTSITYTPTGAAAPVTIPLATDTVSQTKLVGVRQAFDDSLVTSVSFIDTAGNVHTLDEAGAKAVHQQVLGFVQALFTAVATAITKINASPATITTRKQIDALYAPIAPNSPSALTPSAT